MQCIYKKDMNNKFYGCMGMCFISHLLELCSHASSMFGFVD